MRQVMSAGVCAIAAGVASSAAADISFVSQQRTISVATSSDGNLQAESVEDLSSFVRTLNIATTFPGTGGTVPNIAGSRIDCQIDPNSIRATGSLNGAGGIGLAAGNIEFGEARASVRATFIVDSPVQFSLRVAPRPDLEPTDEFRLELRDLTRNFRHISLEEFDPPQQVALNGTLQPGEYLFRYQIETTFDGAEDSRSYSFNLTFGCPADINGVDGVTLGDALDFLAAYFAREARADFNRSGEVSVQDVFDFLTAYFIGCA